MTNAITSLRRGIVDFFHHALDIIGQRVGWRVRTRREKTVYEAYMEQTKLLAEQYEREAPVFKTEELEALYDDAYFAALERRGSR